MITLGNLVAIGVIIMILSFMAGFYARDTLD